MSQLLRLTSQASNLTSLPSHKVLGVLGTLGLLASAVMGIKSKQPDQAKKLAGVSLGALAYAWRLRNEAQERDKALQSCQAACTRVNTAMTKFLIIVNFEKQKLHLYEDLKLQRTYTISTSEYGEGLLEGSNQTPWGLHRISEKIGERASPYAIFESRVDTGRTCKLGDSEKNCIVGRILWLEGMQEGLNRGLNAGERNVDSKTRYIYIHGTNRTDLLGEKASGGCVRMAPRDIVQLFNIVPAQTLVYLHKF